ncbi:MAG: hypothetical protein KAU38_08350 [Desulfobacterales bacterium]|nr:hypothetical protein [Desulfobacterales bacterium]
MKRIIAGKIMMALVLIAVLGGVYQARYNPVELVQGNEAALILGLLLWSVTAWVFIRSGKKARKDSRIGHDEKEHCISCGRWVPAPYLREGQYCYDCFKKIRGAGEDTAHEEARHRETIQNAMAGREPFPYQAELDRRVFESLANEEERDGATMIQAMAESDGDKEKAKARYFRLRYKQMNEAHELARFMREILEEKAKLSHGKFSGY